jgi:hypothetical protein
VLTSSTTTALIVLEVVNPKYPHHLAGVIGVAELLLQTDLTIEQRTYVETIRSSGDTLLALINDVLDLSKVPQHKYLDTFPFGADA